MIGRVEELIYLIRAYRRTRRKLRDQAKPLLLLHTMGKVGSSTLWHSLKAAGLKKQYRVLRTHFLSPQGVDYFRKVHQAGYSGWNAMTPRAKSMVSTVRVQGHLIRPLFSEAQRAKIVTVVRDPIRTNIAGFFQNSGWWEEALIKSCKNNSDDCLPGLQTSFLKNYPHVLPLNWFEQELRQLFSLEFPADTGLGEQGYRIFSSRTADVLVIRLEKLTDCAERAFHEFLGVENFHLVNANESEKKWYHEIYKRFQKEVRLPESYVNEIYGSAYSRSFFSGEDLAKLRAQWKTAQDEPSVSTQAGAAREAI